jgi:hypothetical protein
MERCFVWLIALSILTFFWLTLREPTQSSRVQVVHHAEVEPQLSVLNLPPLSRILLQARLKNSDGKTIYSSQAVFQSDANGQIDLARQTPFKGDYTGYDALGLLWSMNQEDKTCELKIEDKITMSLLISVEGGVMLTHETVVFDDPDVIKKFAQTHEAAI